MLIWIVRFIFARRIKGLRTWTLGLRACCNFAERQWILQGFWAFLHTWHQPLMSTRKCLYKLPLNLSVGVWGKNHILVLRDSHVVSRKSPNEIISFNKIHLLVLSNVCLAMWGKQRLDWEYILSSDNVPTPVPVICTTQAATQSLHSFSLFCCTYMRTYVSAGQKQKSPPNCHIWHCILF